MNEWKVGLTQSAMDDSEQTIQCLIEASNEIFNSSEADFEQMKSKKWYNRLWETVTFSKDNEKKLARGVSNLAQLQEIITKVLLIVSGKSAEISEIIAENASSINRLSDNQEAILKAVEKIKYGFDRQITLADLDDNRLYIVVNSLAKVALETDASEQGKRYVQTILKAAGFSAIDTSMEWDFIEQLDADEMTLLYQILEEYLYLATNSFESDSEAFEYISLSPRKCREIQQRIRNTELIAGADFFIEFYETENYEYTWIDEDGLEFVEEDENTSYTQGEETYEKNIELEEITISDNLYITSEETKTFQNKTIHFNADIYCAGNLIFDHCVLYYNETTRGDKISLSDAATLTITNSYVINKGFNDEVTFINGECAKVAINSTTFKDCSYFMNLDSLEFTLTKSELKNCYSSFLHWSNYEDNAVFEISNCTINTIDIADFQQRPHYASISSYLIYIGSYPKNFVFINNKIISSDSAESKNKGRYLDLPYDSKICNCTFEGLNSPIWHNQFSECHFINCKGCIRTSSEGTVENCLFENCTDIINAGGNSKIINCQFENCYDRLIESGNYGNVKIEFSKFDNISWKNIDNRPSFWGPYASCILLNRGKKENASSLKNCIFDRVELNEGFLISAPHQIKSKGETVAYIEGCDFKNCTTKRTDREIIKKLSTYDGLLKKDQTFEAFSISDCKGIN